MHTHIDKQERKDNICDKLCYVMQEEPRHSETKDKRIDTNIRETLNILDRQTDRQTDKQGTKDKTCP